MTTCIRCGRRLKSPTPSGMGPKCTASTRVPEPTGPDLFGFDIQQAVEGALRRLRYSIWIATVMAHRETAADFRAARERMGL